MPVLHTAWMYYLSHSALVLNGLALFYAISGSWLCLATQLRSLRRASSLATQSGTTVSTSGNQRINRLFYAVAGVCLALALLLSLLSTLV